MGVDRTAAGFTILEVVVSLTIAAVGVAAVAGVLHTSVDGAVETGARTRAVALATAELETLRVNPPLLPASSTRTITVGGRTYEIEQDVAVVAVHGQAAAGREASVRVRWTDGGGQHEIEQHTLLDPGPSGPATTTTTAPPPGTPMPPLAVTATAVTTNAHAGAGLAWVPQPSTPPVRSWVIEYSTDGFATAHFVAEQAARDTTRVVSGLTPGVTYTFRVAGRAANGQLSAWSNLATVTTAVSLLPDCSVGLPTVTPPAVQRLAIDPQRGLVSDLLVTINSRGTCSGLRLDYEPAPELARSVPLTRAPSQIWSATLAGSDPWTIGPHEVAVIDGAGVRRGSFIVTVCHYEAAGCS